MVVFKDNYAARSFRVPVGWFSRLGAGVGFLMLATLLVSLAAVKYYRLAHQGDPGRIGSLEEEIHDLKSQNEILAAKARSANDAALAAAAAAKNVTPAPNVTTAPVQTTPTPVATATTPAAIPTAPAMAIPITAGNVLIFRDLPLNVLAGPSDPASIPITVQMQKVAWKGKNLNVQFAIQYTGSSGGNQQGRIVILARGPSTVLSYPDQAFNPGTSPALIAPERGEYFSVSRYRETRAEFGPINSTDSLREVEILIFGSPAGASDESGFELLIHQRVAVEAPAKVVPKPAPKPKPRPEPKAEPAADDAADPAAETSAPAGAATPAEPAAPPAEPAKKTEPPEAAPEMVQ